MSDDLTEKIVNAAIEVHTVLGPGLLESFYEEALCHEFGLRGMFHQQRVAIEVNYKQRAIHGQRLDLSVEREVIVEIKSLQRLPEVATLRYCRT